MNNPYSREFPSIYRGIVEDNRDPENLGRCRVRVPSVHGKLDYSIELLPWARPIVSSAVHIAKGVVNIPDIGDIVWIFFEGAVKDFPIYIGGAYSRDLLPIDINKVILHSEGESMISYDRVNKSYEIQAGSNHIILDNNGIHILGDIIIQGSIDVSGTINTSGGVTNNVSNNQGGEYR